ncbi:hypothetical protein [Bradyrhizobium sp. JYMT SZCCT0428]|uniref:hypothetical protein n=1 Tax=Bradyrhizobium sp. JYMT SZCCT0428 TaxID=2807673 RepID=UPI001BADBA67|nr:hypothetical protein [Bradyrhizobium sp. JYMT SZCCT0428]MBR1156047.1 hypothetical protein [Bradyrhizobium sp. JYMT SZCCT0428]
MAVGAAATPSIICKDMVLRRDQTVHLEHRQVTLDGLDIGVREPVGDHARAIFLTYDSRGALCVEQGVGPQRPLVVRPRLVDIEAECALCGERHPLQLGQLPLDDSAKHCLDLRR